MPAPLLLDYETDALLPNGYTEVTTEVEWLEVASTIEDSDLSDSLVLVRGAELCKWAKIWWEARGGSTDKCISPSKRLCALYSGLDVTQAWQLLQEIPVAARQYTLKPAELLPLLYPDTTSWIVLPTHPSDKYLREHIAQWLLWVADGPAAWPAHHLPVLRALAAFYQQIYPEAAALWLTTSEDASQVLRQWLAISTEGRRQTELTTAMTWAGAFPLDVPSAWIQQARALFTASLPALPGDSISAAAAARTWWAQRLLPHQPSTIRTTAASVLADFVKANPSAASQPLLQSLSAELPSEVIDQLRSLVPPPLLPALPTSGPNAVLDWVTRSYLPYRQWQITNSQEEAAAHVSTAARAFGEWLLQVYPTQLLDAAQPYQQLYWAKQANHPKDDEVVIWVIADGLGWADAQSLLRLITEKSTNQPNGMLAATLARPCFGLLPTITSHTKDPLRWGVPYAHLAYIDNTAPPDLKSNANLTAAAKAAKAGDLLVWRPYDPDPIYHQQVDAEVARHLVQGALSILATRIAAAANAVPPSLIVRVLITTDHGRLLSDSSRELLAPPNCQVEGRTAHLAANAPAVRPAPDDRNVRWLDPQTYCIPNWAGVVIGESAFRVPVGDTTKGGRAPYPHGGVWPEEVVLPWLELVRDAGPVKLVATLTGAGRAGFPGTAQLHLRNESRHTLNVRQFNTVISGQMELNIALNDSSPAMKTVEIPIELLIWPDSAQAQSSKLTVLVETASGHQVSISVKAKLQNTGLQDRGIDINAEFNF